MDGKTDLVIRALLGLKYPIGLGAISHASGLRKDVTLKRLRWLRDKGRVKEHAPNRGSLETRWMLVSLEELNRIMGFR